MTSEIWSAWSVGLRERLDNLRRVGCSVGSGWGVGVPGVVVFLYCWVLASGARTVKSYKVSQNLYQPFRRFCMVNVEKSGLIRFENFSTA